MTHSKKKYTNLILLIIIGAIFIQNGRHVYCFVYILTQCFILGCSPNVLNIEWTSYEQIRTIITQIFNKIVLFQNLTAAILKKWPPY